MCTTCLQDKVKAEADNLARKDTKEKLKSALTFLTGLGPDFPKLSNQDMHLYLLSTEWMSTWKKYVDNLDELSMPVSVDNDQFVCEHKLFKYDITTYVAAKLDSTIGLVPDPPFVFLKEDQWQQVLAVYGGDKSIPLVVNITAQEQDGKHRDFVMSPPVCHECAKAQQEVDEKKRLTYTDATITIEVRPEKKDESNQQQQQPDPQAFATVTNSRSRRKGNRGKYTRSNPTRYHLRHRTTSEEKKTYRVEGVASSQTLQILKLQIFQLTEIAPFQMNLFLDGKILDNDEKTLFDYKIFPNSVLELEKCLENQSILDGKSI
jgi:ubiquitin carboxyl-terminal hydrolase 48